MKVVQINLLRGMGSLLSQEFAINWQTAERVDGGECWFYGISIDALGC